jgi:hypothetical protein
MYLSAPLVRGSEKDTADYRGAVYFLCSYNEYDIIVIY